MVGVAENVTDEPEQVGLFPAEIFVTTEGVKIGLTVTVMEFELTVAGSAHETFEVKAQLTTCPLVSVVLVYEVLLVPTFDPLTFH